MKKIAIINGPNLNLLGKREPELYGNKKIEEHLLILKKSIKANIFLYQSNYECEIIDILHYIGFEYHGIIINPGAYTHTSLAIADAIKSISTPVIEVHITNIFCREKIRNKSLITEVCKGSIFGLGLKSYDLGIFSFLY
ncbi:type II 3-dehydroquinate dehydratase [Candidatus Karelsulcia muelleri]|uniref:3-dehydroquinate dehydratase n=1 Tax=Candidatus Karelsulcia muelleri PSPU TaxID=1189303 RepID=A0AAD1AYZ7_9FLAO|nr:type II 3-dehydroquinate dehydratase [Candidatus Karelsulcia muelleri]NJJ98795.1 3-dehydroquinate dehydratase [Candidatus Karelsulcia muelleri]BAO66196.1 3-dehydroquinate dehydratase [Candidatus Karelsulcia muelleri PSPU]